MKGGDFDELEFFRAIEQSGVRALLIGRRALVALGLPVLTADYDFWIHIDDIAAFNAAASPYGLVPTKDVGEAKRFAARPKDLEDIRLLQILRDEDGS